MVVKKNVYIFILYFTFIICEEYSYAPSYIINYINKKIDYKEDKYKSFIEDLSKTFSDVYTFNDICKNPPQPDFNSNYHNKVDIQKELNEIDLKDITPYEFYRKVRTIISKLKDQHIEMKWKPLDLDKFNILGPIDYSIKEDEEGNIRIFGECIDEDQLDNFENSNQVVEVCIDNTNTPIKSINDMDPFEFVNNFGGNFLETKNVHSTFSFKLRYHNNVPLDDYPLSLEELQNYKVEFDSGDSFETEYLITSDIDIKDEKRLRNLDEKVKISKKKILKKEKNTEKKLIGNSYYHLLNMYSFVYWNYKDEDVLKCRVDNDNEVNIYYISSFDKNHFSKTLENCYKLFDENKYPIIIINDNNNGGIVSLSQLFLGITSPLMPIKLYNGRLRITESLKENEEIKNYINSNLTNINYCINSSYDKLMNNTIKLDYGNNIESELTEVFYLNNKAIHNDIEKARITMKNKRKPTEILVYTDGYSFSAASLYLKYLKENGGAIIAQYLGNPQKKNEKFDISQSPSPIFMSSTISLFSKENYKKLLKEYECELQLPGIQSFHNSSNAKTPLEYEISLPDEQSEIYEVFDDDNYDKFIKNAKSIFEKYKTKCNPHNKKLVNISQECDKQFNNNYTHGGYECGDNGEWSDKCVPSYCDMGYSFDEINKKCIKDVCSSKEIGQESGKEINETDINGKEINETDINGTDINGTEYENPQIHASGKKKGFKKYSYIGLSIILFLLLFTAGLLYCL